LGLRRLVVEAYTYTHTHTPDRLLWMSDQLVAEASTYPTYNQHKRRTSMPSVEFESAISGIKRSHGHTATGIGLHRLGFIVSHCRLTSEFLV